MSRIKIDRETEVLIVSNMHSYYSFSNGRNIAFELDGFETDEYLTYGELKTLSTGRSKGILQNMHILIVDVLSDEVGLDDVVTQLRLADNYRDAKKVLGLDEDEILEPEHFVDFVNEASAEEIEKVLKEYPFMTSVIEEISVKEYRDKNIESEIMAVVLKHRGVKEEELYEFLDDIRVSAS